MSVDIYCNGNFFNIKNIQCYKDEIVFNTNIECEKEKNKIILLILNPRTNIDSLLYCSEFFLMETSIMIHLDRWNQRF